MFRWRVRRFTSFSERGGASRTGHGGASSSSATAAAELAKRTCESCWRRAAVTAGRTAATGRVTDDSDRSWRGARRTAARRERTRTRETADMVPVLESRVLRNEWTSVGCCRPRISFSSRTARLDFLLPPPGSGVNLGQNVSGVFGRPLTCFSRNGACSNPDGHQQKSAKHDVDVDEIMFGHAITSHRSIQHGTQDPHVQLLVGGVPSSLPFLRPRPRLLTPGAWRSSPRTGHRAWPPSEPSSRAASTTSSVSRSSGYTTSTSASDTTSRAHTPTRASSTRETLDWRACLQSVCPRLN